MLTSMKFKMALYLVFLIFSGSSIAETIIEANNKNANAYYYSLKPVDSNCGFSIESGWTAESTWKYAGTLPACDYRVQVWTDLQLKTPDNTYTIYATTQMASLTQSNGSAATSGMLFSVYSMLPDDDFLALVFPEDLQASMESLLQTYPALIPDENSVRLSNANFYDRTPPLTVTYVDVTESNDWCAGSMPPTEEMGFTDRTTVCTKYDMLLELHAPDAAVFANIDNALVKPGVANLLLFPGTSEGFDFDWRVSGPSLVAYPYPMSYWAKGFAYLQVPVSGEYRFASQSTGGVKATILDEYVNEIPLLRDSDWRLNAEQDACSSGEINYRLTTKVTTSIFGIVTEVNRDDDDRLTDPSGRVFTHDEVKLLLYQLAGFACANNAEERSEWGESVYLSADKIYPLSLSLWSGWKESNFKIHVSAPDGTEGLLPMGWLVVPSNFDTEKGWHGSVEVTGLLTMDNSEAIIASSVSSAYDFYQGRTVAAIAQVDSSRSSVEVNLYSDDGASWEDISNIIIDNIYDDIDNLQQTISSDGSRLGLLVSNQNKGGGALVVVDYSNSINPIAKMSSVDSSVMLSGDLAMSADGSKIAIGALDSVLIYKVINNEWVIDSAINISVVPNNQNNGIIFSPMSANILYIAENSGFVKRYDYKGSGWWTAATGFEVQGSNIAISATGRTLAIGNGNGIDIYIFGYGGEKYVTTISSPDRFGRDIGLTAIDDYTLIFDGQDFLYVYTIITSDWSATDPDWRVIYAPGWGGIQSLWLAPSSISGAKTVGVLPSNSNSDVQLYRIGPDDMKTEERGRAVNVEVDNLSESVIEGYGITIDPLSSKQFVMNRGALNLSANKVLKWTLAGASDVNFHFSRDVYTDSTITIIDDVQHISEVSSAIYCPYPEDIDIDILNDHYEYGQYMRVAAQGQLLNGKKIPLILDNDGLINSTSASGFVDIDILSPSVPFEAFLDITNPDKKIAKCAYNVNGTYANGDTKNADIFLVYTTLLDEEFDSLTQIADYSISPIVGNEIYFCNTGDYCAISYSPYD